MSDQNPGLIIPQPIYQLNPDLALSLKEEIIREREKTANLAKQLEIQRHKKQQLEEYLKSITAPGRNSFSFFSRSQESFMSKSESVSSFASLSGLQLDNRPRACSPNSRRQKIEKYKNKIRNYRQRVTFSRSFTGRSKVAKVKPRVNGKFIKISSYDTFGNTNINS